MSDKKPTSNGRTIRDGVSSGRVGSSSNKQDRVGISPGQSAESRRSHGRQSRGRSRKRKQRFNWLRILICAIAAFCIIAGIIFFAKGFSQKEVNSKPKDVATSSEAQMSQKIKVNDVNIAGLTREKAKEEILKSIGWDLKVSYNGTEYEIHNLLEDSVEEILKEIYTMPNSKKDYTIEATNVDDAITQTVAEIAKQVDLPAKDAGISSYDTASGKFLFSKEEAGTVLEQDVLKADIKAAVDSKEYRQILSGKSVESLPSLTEAQARERYRVISTFQTKTTSNADRNTNIRLATEAINGVVIPVGGTFSINDTTGERAFEKGYRPAGAYVNGVLVEEPGGGVCQVSSTLYNAVVESGLKTTERYAHSYEPSYVNAGEDAMISFPNLDMKFLNNSPDAVGILATFSNQTLKISIYGIPILEEGVTVGMETVQTGVTQLPPTYEEDPSLQPGQEVVVKKGSPETKYLTYLIVKKNGEVTSKESFHNSTYKGKNPIIRRNSTGVAPSPPATAASNPSESIQDGTLDTVIPEQGAAKPENTETSGGGGETTQAPVPETPAPTEAPTGGGETIASKPE